MVIIKNVHTDDRQESAPSLITVASISFGVASLITGIWVALGVLLVGS